MHHGPVGHDRHLRARAHNLGTGQRHAVVPRRDLPLGVGTPGYGRLVRLAVKRSAVDALGLEEDHRVGIFDRADQQPLRVIGIRWHHDLDAADVGEYAFRTL